MTFDELDFKKDYEIGGVGASAYFANGYGAHIVRHPYSYGYLAGLYELSVLRHGEICYDTHITSDVLGYLTPNAVTDVLLKIENLSSCEKD